MAHLNLLLDDETSYTVPRESSDIEGFCDGYALRRHKFEDKAIEGSLQCREDWLKYIGSIERWGCNNPWEGHFGAVVLPLCKPERLGVISYIFECMQASRGETNDVLLLTFDNENRRLSL